jgi:hypothetical protein
MNDLYHINWNIFLVIFLLIPSCPPDNSLAVILCVAPFLLQVRHQTNSIQENPWSRLATDTTSQHPSAKQSNPEHTKDEAGVCEAYAGIIESSDIDPLHHELAKGIILFS